MKEMTLGEARAMGLTEQIAGLEGWPDEVRLVVTLPVTSDIASQNIVESGQSVVEPVSDIVSQVAVTNDNTDSTGAASDTDTASGSDQNVGIVEPDVAEPSGN